MTEASPEFESVGESAPRRSFARRLLVALLLVVIVGSLGAAAFLHRTRERYAAEIARLRSSMSALERARADRIIAAEDDKLELALLLIRKQARFEPALHLSVAFDSSAMHLEHEGAILRVMPVDIGVERTVGIAPDTVRLARPRGVRTVIRVMSESDAWEVPAWVYVDRGLPMPAERAIGGALGPRALVLDGGTVIYSIPAVGPLTDSSYVLPGSIRARTEDLAAIFPNVHAGMRVYLY